MASVFQQDRDVPRAQTSPSAAGTASIARGGRGSPSAGLQLEATETAGASMPHLDRIQRAFCETDPGAVVQREETDAPPEPDPQQSAMVPPACLDEMEIAKQQHTRAGDKSEACLQTVRGELDPKAQPIKPLWAAHRTKELKKKAYDEAVAALKEEQAASPGVTETFDPASCNDQRGAPSYPPMYGGGLSEPVYSAKGQAKYAKCVSTGKKKEKTDRASWQKHMDRYDALSAKVQRSEGELKAAERAGDDSAFCGLIAALRGPAQHAAVEAESAEDARRRSDEAETTAEAAAGDAVTGPDFTQEAGLRLGIAKRYDKASTATWGIVRSWEQFGAAGGESVLSDVLDRYPEKADRAVTSALGGEPGSQMCLEAENRKAFAAEKARWDREKAEERKRQQDEARIAAETEARAAEARSVGDRSGTEVTEADPARLPTPVCRAPEPERSNDSVDRGWTQANELSFPFMGTPISFAMLKDKPSVTLKVGEYTYPKAKEDREKSLGEKAVQVGPGGVMIGGSYGASLGLGGSLKLEATTADEDKPPRIDVKIGGSIAATGKAFGKASLRAFLGAPIANVNVGAELEGSISLGGSFSVSGGATWTPGCGWMGRLSAGAEFQSKLALEPSAVGGVKLLWMEQDVIAFKLGAYEIGSPKLAVSWDYLFGQNAQRLKPDAPPTLDPWLDPKFLPLEDMRDEFVLKHLTQAGRQEKHLMTTGSPKDQRDYRHALGGQGGVDQTGKPRP